MAPLQRVLNPLAASPSALAEYAATDSDRHVHSYSAPSKPIIDWLSPFYII